MKRSRLQISNPADRAGFTLIELVVVLGVVAVLLALQIPVMARATRQTAVAQCAENLRQFTFAVHIYAREFNNKLPDNAAGNWAWDMKWSTGTQLERYGAPWKVLYCPGSAPNFDDQANLQLYNYIPNNVRVVGYALTFPGTFTVASTNQNPTLEPPLVQVGFGVFKRELAAQRVLLADVTIS